MQEHSRGEVGWQQMTAALTLLCVLGMAGQMPLNTGRRTVRPGGNNGAYTHTPR